MSIIDLNASSVFNAIGGGSPLSIISSFLKPQYVIRDAETEKEALVFSGMSRISPGGRAQITTAPVEKGQYQSINKVREPSIIRCEILVNGLTGYSGNIPNIFDFTLTSQSKTLETISDMLKSAKVYNIETPKETLRSYDLVEHSYEVSNRTGVTLLTVYLYFQEVMQQMEVSLSGAQTDTPPADNDTSGGDAGIKEEPGKGESKPSSLDKLSASWDSLKKSVGGAVEAVVDEVNTGFQSALETVTKPLSDVAASAAEKAADLSKSITDSLTGPRGKA